MTGALQTRKDIKLATGLLGVLDGCPVVVPSEDGNTYAIQSASVEILVGTTPITPVITSPDIPYHYATYLLPDSLPRSLWFLTTRLHMCT